MQGINWIQIFNEVFPLINNQMNRNYYSGPRYLQVIKNVDASMLDYSSFIDDRKRRNLSTTRRDYFLDVLLQCDDSSKITIIETILKSLVEIDSSAVTKVRSMLAGIAVEGPVAKGVEDKWGTARLVDFFERIDREIAVGNYNAANTFIYTCLEGTMKEFAREKQIHNDKAKEPVDLARLIVSYMKSNSPGYPAEVLNLISNITHAIDKTRNSFSDSHYDEVADRWVAIFLRDCLNSLARLLMVI